MRPYRQYLPDQAALLPPSLADLIPADDPVYFVREVVDQLDLGAFHDAYRCERGQPPYHPKLMVGLYFSTVRCGASIPLAAWPRRVSATSRSCTW